MTADLAERAATAQDTDPAAGSVFWAWIHGEDVRAAFMSSVFATMMSPASVLVGSFFDFGSGPLLSLARNACAEAFLESKQEWLFFVDTDTVFGPHVLPALLELADPADCPVLSAAVPVIRGNANAGSQPGGTLDLAWSAFETAPGGELSMLSARMPLGTRQRVAAVGTGCVLIHRSVLEAIGDGPFNEESHGKHCIGEDLAFCRRATAKGFPIHVTGSVRVGHAKVVTL